MRRYQLQLPEDIIATAVKLASARLTSTSDVLRGWVLAGMHHDRGIIQTNGIHAPVVLSPQHIANQLTTEHIQWPAGLPHSYPPGTPASQVDRHYFRWDGQQYVRRNRPLTDEELKKVPF